MIRGPPRSTQGVSSAASDVYKRQEYMGFQMMFALDKEFVETFRDKPTSFGFNGLGEIAYRRSYSRVKEDGNKEEWFETVERVVNGLSLIHISEPTRPLYISYAVFCLKKKNSTYPQAKHKTKINPLLHT
eukprot:TRINITY_DN60380_c0_g1_i1.p2 TRINITY_DN60380_c0_g1~~TRINITY_DN60380_c0_g1_i1.p2  ORF type:complete len:130 (+),score=26.44 TRINITY_DN60380_c0_g1_i1:78-467(+)